MRFALVLFAPMLPLFTWFLYAFLKRMLSAFGVTLRTKGQKRLLLLGALTAVLSAALISDMSLLFLLHLAGIGLALQGINFLFKKLLKKRYGQGFSLWKKSYASGIPTLILTAAVLVGGYINLHTVVRTDYTVETEKAIRAEGYRVVLIADVHFGVSLSREELLEKCEEISATDPDMVILCGDMTDNDTPEGGMEDLFEAFGMLKSEFGTFYVHGNHDRSMSMVSNRFSEEELEAALKANGIRLLKDETVMLTEDFALIGREDKSRKNRKELSELTEDLKDGIFRLVLDHQPNQYAENGALGTDLLLSGHTHGGQIFPLNLLMGIIPFNDGTYGAYELSNGGTAIVTSGFAGWNFPIKTAAPAEYAVIDILPNGR